jgi:hypothetical protein
VKRRRFPIARADEVQLEETQKIEFAPNEAVEFLKE